MKALKILPLLLLVVLTNCKKEENLTTADINPVIDNCLKNPLIDSLTIARHIVGEWKLRTTGCVEGCQIDDTAVEGVVSFTQTVGNLIVKQGEKEITNLIFQWNLAFFDVGTNGKGYRLITNPTHYYLGADVFCEQNMFLP